MATPDASVIVRVKDEASTLERTLDSLRVQTVVPEIIVVDSGSTDGCLEIAQRACDHLIEIPSSEFTYGRALNIGASQASAPVHLALSAHCRPERNDWVERSLSHYDRPDVAGTGGGDIKPDGSPLNGTFFQTAADMRANPWWGFTNHASSWRAEVWERFPFDEELDYAEDKEWAWRVLQAGYVLAFEPLLEVDMSHSWRSAVDTYRRRKRAGRAMSSFAPLPPYEKRQLVHDWWNKMPRDSHSRFFHRFVNYKRFASLLGSYVGQASTRRGQ